MIWTGPTGPLPTAEHEKLAGLLSTEQRTWLARMADVLPQGWVVKGMAEPFRGGVVYDPDYPRGLRLVVAPTGRGGASSRLPDSTPEDIGWPW